MVMDTGINNSLYSYLSMVCKLTVTIQDKDRHDNGQLNGIICFKLKGFLVSFRARHKIAGAVYETVT